MPGPREALTLLRDFFDAGGSVLWVIFAVSLLLWTLILERYLYLWWVYPRELARRVDQWKAPGYQSSWFAHQIRAARIHELSLELQRFLPFIKSLIAVCPLLGLLGTVTGMIQVFDVMTVLGTGNPKAMARGISMATIPTMAGLVVAVSGLYFSSHLYHRTRQEERRAADLLRDYAEPRS